MGRVVLVASGKGGVGKSTVTAALSVILSERGKKVLVIDGDTGLGSQDILLGLCGAGVYDWGDVLEGLPAEEAVVAREGGPDLLAAPGKWTDGCDPASFAAMVNGLRSRYDVIFIDAPAGIGGGLRRVSSAATCALVVSDSTRPGVNGALAAGKTLRDAGVLSVRLVINSVRPALIRSGRLPMLDSVIDGAELRLIGLLPYDEEIALGTGDGALEFAPDSLFGKCAAALAKRVSGENVPLTKM